MASLIFREREHTVPIAKFHAQADSKIASFDLA
jgi:hypothetical protein